MNIKEIEKAIEEINDKLKKTKMPVEEYKMTMTKKKSLIKERLMYYIGLCQSIEENEKEDFYKALRKDSYEKSKTFTAEDVWNKSIDYYVGDLA